MKKYLIVGNGVAGTTAAENIRKEDREGSITMVTDEDLPFYYRLRLSEYISGDLTEPELIVKKDAWYRDQDIDLRLSTRVKGSEPKGKTVILENDERLPYDFLLIATGSHSFIPPIKGADKNGVFALRSIRDGRDILAYGKEAEEVVLIGGGLLGLEAGHALLKTGKRVAVVEFFPRLLPRQLDVEGAEILQGIMEEMGFSFKLGAKTEEITGDNRVDGVLLEGGERLSAKMVIISAGVRPNMELADPLELDREKGIRVNERLQTSRPDIYAAGDVAEFKGIPYGIWPAAAEQGKIAGINMAGGDMVYQGTTMANTLKVAGVDLASAGNIDAENELESRVATDKGVYKKIVLDKGRIVGCIMLGNTTGFTKITRAITEKQDISQIKDQGLFEGFH
ncbi:MAG: NAD(P)/FAD-dependent oxidoreductase [Deltaproteobacteria bacterium]|nr:NAD(P)/FAD-dependent oxidoreductase [Deltaproteobacteria bacterium]